MVSLKRLIPTVLGPLLLILLGLGLSPFGEDSQEMLVIAVAFWMVCWWMFEIIPLAITALLPIVMFPMLGIANLSSITSNYGHPLIFLFLGGFMLASALQRWNLHKRLALMLILQLGNKASSLIGGFMLATAFLSMWVSNTATAIMMLPIALSIIDLAKEQAGAGNKGQLSQVFAPALLLSIAYGASIGGVATLIGSPPNTLFAAFMQEATGQQVSFAQWFTIGFPISIVALFITWLLVTRILFPIRDLTVEGSKEMIRQELRELGPLSRGEKMVAAVFMLTAISWMIQPLLQNWVPSFSISDTTIAIASTIILFSLPVDQKSGQFLLNWEWGKKIPWDILLLFGGGLALAEALRVSGVSASLGRSLEFLQGMPFLVLIIATTTLVIFLTEVTSNTATAATLLPIVIALSTALGYEPEFLAFPATIAASLAFMLPVATPPNAIVYSSNELAIKDMMKAGFVLNLVCVVIVSLMSRWLLPLLF